MNKDGYTNNNGNKKNKIKLCKTSDKKIANGRLGKDRGIGNYTCHTTNGNSIIDYAVLSMELLDRQPRAFLSNIQVQEHILCNLPYSDMDVCRSPPAAGDP